MKYLKCAGVALAFDLTFGAIGSASAKADEHVEGFFLGSVVSLILTTIPAIGATAIDRLVHQNLFNNKPLQYGLTALEGFVFNIGMVGLFMDDSKTFTENVEEYFSNDATFAITCCVVSIAKACAFKYILDSADEQPEIDNSQDNPIEDLSVSQVIEVL